MTAAGKDQFIKILATGFGAGLSPVAPGTAGTLVGVLICLLCYPMPWVFRLLFVIAISVLSIYVAGQAETLYGKTDDQRIVIDEIAGLQVAMLPVAITGLHLCLAFVLFRIFDIWKPFPLEHFQKFHGGWGVVADDLGAGVYAGLILFLLTLAGVL
ncbi:MAG: phosphatidylglycerophosphatase A [Smithellaceae bacterium]|nr:phosphatidylglycerophosphatase A [Smithellaceae bacterium]